MVFFKNILVCNIEEWNHKFYIRGFVAVAVVAVMIDGWCW